MKKYTLALLLVLALASQGFKKTDPESLIPQNMTGMVERHNYWRQKVGSPPLQWSEDLAAYAMEWALELQKSNNCKMQHRPDEGKFAQQYGENLYWSKGKARTAVEAVDAWAEELQYWNTETLECNKEWWYCGHYTQLVWNTSVKVGCAMVMCADGEELWVCNYDPPGNWVGEKPY